MNESFLITDLTMFSMSLLTKVWIFIFLWAALDKLKWITDDTHIYKHLIRGGKALLDIEGIIILTQILLETCF